MSIARLIIFICAASILLTAAPAQCESVAAMDFRGKEVRLPRPARRVVCLIESALSGIYMLKQGNRVIAVSRNVYQEPVKTFYAALDPRLAKGELPAPGNWDFVSLERVVALKPDLVLIWAHQTEAISSLEARGIPVYGVFIKSLADVYEEIDGLGKLLGARERAAELTALCKDRLRVLAARLNTARLERPRVYFMWAQGPLETSGAGSMVDELIRLAGGENVAAGIAQEHMVVNLERLLSWNPQVVLMWNNPRLTPKALLERPAWRAIEAGRSQRVHMLPPVFYCDLWTLKFAHAAYLTAAWCHPRSMEGLDLDAERRAFFAQLYGPRILKALAPERAAK
jgi:iron complex transport system substrate-binding protein